MIWLIAILLAIGTAVVFLWLAEVDERDWREVPPPEKPVDFTDRFARHPNDRRRP